MKRIAVNNAGYQVERIQRDNVDYLKVPVIMMNEGVHNGSKGPMLHTADQMQANAASWNMKPVTLTHPQFNNVYCSATENAEVIAAYTVGHLEDVEVKDNALVGNALIQVNLLSTLNETAFTLIENGEAVDVSIGTYANEIAEVGEHNGIQYNMRTESYVPDHLALLPGEQGACSFARGCGIRTYQAKKKLQVNAEFIQIRDVLSRLVDGYDGEQHGYHYLEALTETDFIYRQMIRNEVPKYFRRTYTVSGDADVTVTSEPVEVTKAVLFTPKTIQNNNNNTMNREQRVNAIIANSASGFCDSDREFLTGIPEDRLAAFEVLQANGATPPATPATPAAPVVQANAKPATMDEYLNSMPAEMRGVMQGALAAYAQGKKDNVATIMGAPNNVFTEIQLNAMQPDQLDAMVKLIGTAEPQVNTHVNYLINGSGGADITPTLQANGNNQAPLLPTAPVATQE